MSRAKSKSKWAKSDPPRDDDDPTSEGYVPKLSSAKCKLLKAQQAKAKRAQRKRERLEAEQPWIVNPDNARVTIETKDGTYQLVAGLERFEVTTEHIDLTEHNGPWRRLIQGVNTARFTMASSGAVEFTRRPIKAKR